MEIQTKIHQFANGLRWARRQDGDPSYRELAHRTGYSISSFSRVLNGKSFPKWDLTERFLHACHVPETQITGHWHSWWVEIAELLSPTDGDFPHPEETEPEPAALPQAGTECEECGALITNPLRHQTWHMNYVRRETPRRPPAREVAAGRGNLHRLIS